MAVDLADYTQAVNVIGGSVSITGTATVSILGTPAVTISGTPNVAITNTPAVTISSGSVTIVNASIGVINASGTKITSARPPLSLGQVAITASGTVTTTFAIPLDTQGLVIRILNPLNTVAHVNVRFHPISGNPLGPDLLEVYSFPQSIYVVPLLPTGYDNSLNLLTSIEVKLDASAAGTARLDAWALFEANPLWMQFYPQPQLAPNQAPVQKSLSLANGVAQWLIAPVANVQITLFQLQHLYFGANTGVIWWDMGHNLTLPGVSLTPGIITSGYLQGPLMYAFSGVQLPRGEGVYIEQTNGAPAVSWVGTLVYSLS